MIDAVAARCEHDHAGRSRWSTVPADGYCERHLVHHLRAAGRFDEVRRVVTDPQWPQRKVASSGVTAVLADYELYLAGLAADGVDSVTETFVRALRRAAHVLRRHPEQYALQMYWRIGGLKEVADRFGIDSSRLERDSLRPTEPGDQVASGGVVSQSGERRGNVLCGVLANVAGRLACITGDDRGEVTAVDALTGELVYRIDAHEDDVRALAVEPSRALLATGSGEWLGIHTDCSIKLWDLDTGGARGTLSACEYEEVKLPGSHTEPIADLCFSADGDVLISASWDQSIGIWSLRSMERIATWEEHDQGLNTAALTGDERFVVSGSADGSVGLWDFRKQRFQRFLDPKAGAPLNFRALPDGARVAGVTEGGALLFVDAATGTATAYSLGTGYSMVDVVAHGPRCVLVVTVGGEILHFDEETGATSTIADLGQHVDAIHTGADVTMLAVSVRRTTTVFELSEAPGRARIVEAIPSEREPIIWVVDASGKVDALSAGQPRRVLANTRIDSPVSRSWMTADGLLVRSTDGFRWLRFGGDPAPSRRRRALAGRAVSRPSEGDTPAIVVDRFAPHQSAFDHELISRGYVLTWMVDLWVVASLYRLSNGKPVWENAVVGRPRELDAFLASHHQQAPHKRGSYYTLGSVDYERDRFVLYRNGMEGVLNVDGRSGKLSTPLERELWYARLASFAKIVPGTDWYVEMNRESLSVWDLAHERLLARRDDNYKAADINPRELVLTALTSDYVVRLRLPDLNPLSETEIGPFNGPVWIVATAGDLVVVQDAFHDMQIANTARAAAFAPLGLDAPVAGCAFAPDKRSVLLVDERGSVTEFDLP